MIGCVESLIERKGKEWSEPKYVLSHVFLFFWCSLVLGYGPIGARSQPIIMLIWASFLGRDVACLRLNLVMLRRRCYIRSAIHLLIDLSMGILWRESGDG